MRRHLVIAAYDKDYSWIRQISSSVKTIAYRKGAAAKQSKDEIQLEPNKGRCVHTFFNHIAVNYDNLADITFFCQDYPFDHFEDLIDIVNNYKEAERCQLRIGGYYGFHYNSIKVPGLRGGIMWNLSESKHHGNGRVLICDNYGAPQDSNPLIDMKRYWNRFFNSEPPNNYEFMPGGHFAVTKEHAKLRSQEYYYNICKFLQEEEVAPWIIERLECYIFNPNIK